MRANTGSAPHVFPLGVLYSVGHPTWPGYLCSRKSPPASTPEAHGLLHTDRWLARGYDRLVLRGFLGASLDFGGTVLVRCWGGLLATTSTARSKRSHASGSNSIFG